LAKKLVRQSSKTLESTRTAIRSGLTASIPFSNSETLNKYVRSVGAMNSRTAYEYYARLTVFQGFLTNKYNATLDDIITRINQGTEMLTMY
jgi:subtilase family serine protease